MDLPFQPTLNAALNATATVLLVLGRLAIHRGDRDRHRRLMVAAFACSVLFLVSYLTYHTLVGLRVTYQGPDWGRLPYLAMLLAHTALAALVPVLALVTLVKGLRGNFASHRRWARVTFPIWLFVSITGVLVWLVLYVLTPSGRLALDAAGAS